MVDKDSRWLIAAVRVVDKDSRWKFSVTQAVDRGSKYLYGVCFGSFRQPVAVPVVDKGSRSMESPGDLSE